MKKDLVYQVWIRLADGLWKQSTLTYENREYNMANAWGKAAIRAAEIARHRSPSRRWH